VPIAEALAISAEVFLTPNSHCSNIPEELVAGVKVIAPDTFVALHSTEVTQVAEHSDPIQLVKLAEAVALSQDRDSSSSSSSPIPLPGHPSMQPGLLQKGFINE